MKKTALLFFALTILSLTAFAQNVINPNIETKESPGTIITKIETTKQYTIVSFEQYAMSDSAWSVLNKEIYIQTDIDNKHYNFVKAEGIAVIPETRHTFAKMNDKLAFKIYFKKIPANAKAIDIIEHAGRNKDGINFFNFYNVDLTKSNIGEQQVKITEVVLAPPPVKEQANSDMGDIANMMNAMGPMYNSLTKAALDAQLNFYKQPGKLTELAAIHRKYYVALVKEGFTEDQALKIITASPLVQIMAPQTK